MFFIGSFNWDKIFPLMGSTGVKTGLRGNLLLVTFMLVVFGSHKVNSTDPPSPLLFTQSPYLVIPFEVKVQMYTNLTHLNIRPSWGLTENVTLIFNCTKPSVACLNNTVVIFDRNSTRGTNVTVEAGLPGETALVISSSSTELILRRSYLLVSVARSLRLDIFTDIIGWLMFVCWTTACYPQLITNFMRKSVVGLSFDFVLLNILGFISYSVFNIGMNWVPSVEDEYRVLHPTSENPVALSDTIYGLHDLVIYILVAIQIFVYERGHQTLSKVAICLTGVGVMHIAVVTVLASLHIISVLLCVTLISYVKLGVQLTKFIPQMYLNYSRKSTVGYNIHQVLIDLAGGVSALVQMFLLAYNYNDYESIFGDIAKLGLAVISLFFNGIFITQHYCIYNKPTLHQRTSETDPLIENAVSTDYGSSDRVTGPQMTPSVAWG